MTPHAARRALWAVILAALAAAAITAPTAADTTPPRDPRGLVVCMLDNPAHPGECDRYR